MGRFLIYFSYIGTRYSGVQQQLNTLSKGKPVRTAGGVLEEAIHALRPANAHRIQVSSRTDKGVHALRNTCHVDLKHPDEGMEYDPAVITNVVNYNLLKRGEDVRVLETRRVADDFHSRANAQGRKYVYRLAHIERPGPSMHVAGHDQSREELIRRLKRFTQRSKHPKIPFGNPTPCLDLDKIFVYNRGKLDLSKLLQAATVLSGVHNFTAFSNKHRERETDKHKPPHPVKLLTIGVKRGQPFGQEILRCGVDPSLTENIEFWDIHVRSRSFLYKMVRRCVGGMILVATDRISLSDLEDVLCNPRRDFPFTSSLSFSENGLFLADVEYDHKDLDIHGVDVKTSCSDPLGSDTSSIHNNKDGRECSSQEPLTTARSAHSKPDSISSRDNLSDRGGVGMDKMGDSEHVGYHEENGK